jgi:hypothetical protein
LIPTLFVLSVFLSSFRCIIRALDKETQNYEIEKSSLKSQTVEVENLYKGKIKQLQDDHTENVLRLQRTMKKTMEMEKIKWKGSKEASEESMNAKSKSLIADAISEYQKESSLREESIRAEHVAKLEQVRMEQKALLDQAISAAVREVEQNNEAVIQKMMEDEKNRATQSSIEIKKEKEERMKIEKLLTEEKKQREVLQLEMEQHQHHQSVNIQTVVGRDGLEKRGTANSVMDLESGGGTFADMNVEHEESKSLLSGMTAPTPSKDKKFRPKPLVDVVKGALMRLPKRQRTMVVVYIAFIHLLLLLMIFFK